MALVACLRHVGLIDGMTAAGGAMLRPSCCCCGGHCRWRYSTDERGRHGVFCSSPSHDVLLLLLRSTVL